MILTILLSHEKTSYYFLAESKVVLVGDVQQLLRPAHALHPLLLLALQRSRHLARRIRGAGRVIGDDWMSEAHYYFWHQHWHSFSEDQAEDFEIDLEFLKM